MGEKGTSQASRRRTRRALVLVLRDENRDKAPALMDEMDRLYVSRDEIHRILNDDLARLEAITHHAFPRIVVDFQKRPSEGISFEKVLARLDNKTEFRLIASISPSTNNVNNNPPALHRLGISHLVTVNLSNSLPPGWCSDTGIGSANVVTAPDRLFYLIADLMLDIAMFHSWQAAQKKRELTQNEKVIFSRLKALYAIRNKLDSYYGPIHDRNLEYFCFASTVRRGRVLDDDDCARYEKLWSDFFSTEVHPLFLTQDESSDKRPFPGVPMGNRAVQSIFAMLNRKMVGQISRKELERRIAPLGAGQYYLIIAVKKPNRERQKERLLYIFSKTKWRSNMWTIRPEASLPKSILDSPFIERVPFTLE